MSERGPEERRLTVREAIRQELERGAASAKELSRAVGISEKDVSEHLEHLRRSVDASGASLQVTPAECLACSYVFTQRARYTKPSRCPECASERIEPPVFSIQRNR